MRVNRLLLYVAEVVFIVCFSGYLLIHMLACTSASSGVLVGTAVGAATGKTVRDVQTWRAIGGAVGSYNQMEKEKEGLRAQQEAQRRELEQQRAAEEERIKLAREQLEQQRRIEAERLRKEREEVDKQLELERKRLDAQTQLERDRLAEQKRQFGASRQPDTGQEKPVYSKANNPNMDSGNSVSGPLTVEKKEAVTDKSLDDERAAIAEEMKKLQQELKRSEELLAKMSQVLEGKLAEDKVSKEAAGKKPQEQEIKGLKPEVDNVPLTTKELPTERTEQKQVAYVPEMPKNIFDELRSGKGPFKIDDFEDKDLRSNYFHDWWKDYTQGQASVTVSSDPTQGAGGTSSSMKIEYSLNQPKASVAVNIGGWRPVRGREVEKDKSTAYDLSRFDKMVFYLKGSKKKGLLLRPNKITVQISCYGEEMKSERGIGAYYRNKMVIRPEQEWQKVEIPLKDFEPSAWTRHYVAKYPPKLDLRNVLGIEFVFSSYEADGGYPGSNTVWIDEIMLE